jgi:predicted secreted hydrolase
MKLLLTLLVLSSNIVWGKWIEPPARSAKGYRVPTPDYQPVLPRDHGSHPEHGIEWWYWVGHLNAVDSGKNFGFQSTIFRLAGDPEKSGETQSEPFGNQNLFLVHTALSDLEEEKYIHHERVMREGWQARSSEKTLSLTVGGVKVSLLEKENRHKVVTRYPDGAKLELMFKPSKPLVSFGDRGLSRKGADPASVSWYWSYTRLEAKGTLFQNGEEIAVEGIAWMDHEISSSQLGEDLAGWDWTCMQLDDGTELKAYRLRKKDGGSDPWSAVYWIDQKGNTEKVYADSFTWETLDTWTSPKTGLQYPTSVEVSVKHPTNGQQVYQLRPLLNAQEFTGNRADNAYWEGACEVLSKDGKRIGLAYLELAGYGGGLGARLN